ILLRHGLDPDRDVSLEPARDDVARLGLLQTGDARAAVLSSAIPPPRMQSLGFATLLFFGDEMRIPTTGLTAREEFIREQPTLVREMTGALHQALQAIADSPAEVASVVGELLHDAGTVAQQTCQLLSPLFTRDGRAGDEATQTALALANQELPAGQLRAEDVYDYSFLPD
ncbi:MAG: hypothetical protein ACRD2R_00520, partial [Terriglobales bacterium]